MKISLDGVTVTSIYERVLGDISMLIPGAQPAALAEIPWMKPHYVDESGEPYGAVQAFVLEVGDQVVLVDCCIGECKTIPVSEDWSTGKTEFLEQLRDAGFSPERIDVVLCSHMHLDHVGWNTVRVDDRWMPTFPRARYLFARTEFEHWEAVSQAPVTPADSDAGPIEQLGVAFQQTQVNSFEESIRPVVDAGLVDLVDLPYDVAAGVRLVPTPGHTPGHASLRVRSAGGDELFISGDAFHHPSQIAHPEWSSLSDDDPEQAVSTRERILAELVDTPVRLVGTHFASPMQGLVVRDGTGRYRLSPVDGDATSSLEPGQAG